MNATEAMSNSQNHEKNPNQTENSGNNDSSSTSSPLSINTQMVTQNHQEAIKIPELPSHFLNNFSSQLSSSSPLPPAHNLPPPHLNSFNNTNHNNQNSSPQTQSNGETKTLASGTIPSPVTPPISNLPPVHVPEQGQISSPSAPLSSGSTGSNQASQYSNNSDSNPPLPATSGRKKIKTRFPLARIKRIMQDNEEVGKIATVAPHLISKSLELFVAELVNKSSEITQERNAKTMSSHHLKECINNEENFDFLRDLVEHIPNRNGNSSEPKKKRRKT
eukprot:gb/GECH01012070.1/.p1 GENE.gb/GECH01012070.1/~~gb/GECH01012070.1/.p1  ORF type:complete len:276 (+),score=60.92 gb/GECH01012070.1/:1-828(+)